MLKNSSFFYLLYSALNFTIYNLIKKEDVKANIFLK